MHIKKIDENAINKLKTLITKSVYLTAENVEYRGTTPCYDGDIVLFNNVNQSKNGGASTARIQVKGKVVSKFSDILVYNKLQLSDLETYRNDNGVIFFVVAMKNEVNDIEKDAVIYYKTFFRNEINEILKTNQKTYSESFRKIDNSDELLKIVKYFIVNRNPMTYPLIRLENIPKENIGKFFVDGIQIGKYSAKFTEFSTLNVEVNDVVRAVDFSFENMQLTKEVKLKIEGREYNSSFKFIISKNEIENQTIIALGIIILMRKSSVNLNFKLKQEFDFYNSFLISKTFQAIKECKQVEINGAPLTLLEISKIDEDLNFVKVVEIIVEIYQEFELLGISFNEIQLKTILVELNIVKKFMNLFQMNTINFNKLAVCKTHLYFTKVLGKIFLIKKEVDENSYEYNSLPFINGDLEFSVNLINDETNVRLPLIMCIKDWVLNDKKFDPIALSDFYFKKELIVNDLITKINDDNLIFYNDFALCLINGFDKNDDKLSLEIAEIIFSNLVNTSSNILFQLNYQQILLRLNKSIDKSAIRKIERETKNNIIKFACFVILNDCDLSSKFFKTLEENNLEDLEDTPIMNLYYSMNSKKNGIT